MKGKEYEMKWLWPDLRNCAVMGLKEPRESMRNLIRIASLLAKILALVLQNIVS
jgi:hypothetical protein